VRAGRSERSFKIFGRARRRIINTCLLRRADAALRRGKFGGGGGGKFLVAARALLSRGAAGLRAAKAFFHVSPPLAPRDCVGPGGRDGRQEPRTRVGILTATAALYLSRVTRRRDSPAAFRMGAA
jgi:hypothetical protein